MANIADVLKLGKKVNKMVAELKRNIDTYCMAEYLESDGKNEVFPHLDNMFNLYSACNAYLCISHGTIEDPDGDDNPIADLMRFLLRPYCAMDYFVALPIEQREFFAPIDSRVIPSQEMIDAVRAYQRKLKQFINKFTSVKVKQHFCDLFLYQVRILSSIGYAHEIIEGAIAEAKAALESEKKGISYYYELLFDLDRQLGRHSFRSDDTNSESSMTDEDKMDKLKDYFVNNLSKEMLSLFEFNYRKEKINSGMVSALGANTTQFSPAKRRMNELEEPCANKARIQSERSRVNRILF